MSKQSEAGAQSLRAVIYTRVSDDSSGRGRSPAEQETDARRDCDRNGWPVTDVITDNDRGASRYSRGTRPGFAQLQQLAASGSIDIIVVWEASRLQRDLAVYVALRDLCRTHGVRWSYNGRLHDLDDVDDAFNTGLDALLSEREVGVTSKRVRRAVDANALAGLPHGPALLGYRRLRDPHTGQLLGQEADPEWAPLIRGVFDRVAAGRSLYSVATWLNTQGATLPRSGKPWTGARVQSQLRGKVGYLGHRTHHGRIIVENAWPALVDDSTFNRVQAILTDPTRRPRRTGRDRALLTGLAACGRCDGRVDATTIGRRGEQVRIYRCGVGAHVGRDMARVDADVARILVARLADPDCLTVFAHRAGDAALLRVELDAVKAQLDDVEAQLAARTMPAGIGARVATSLLAQADELQGRLDRALAGTPPVLLALVGVDAQRRWDRADADERNLAASVLLTDVRLLPVPRGSRSAIGLSFRWVGSTTLHTL